MKYWIYEDGNLIVDNPLNLGEIADYFHFSEVLADETIPNDVEEAENSMAKVHMINTDEDAEYTLEEAPWYALICENNENDHSNGSFRLAEAYVKAWENGCKKIAVIDADSDFCLDEIIADENGDWHIGQYTNELEQDNELSYEEEARILVAERNQIDTKENLKKARNDIFNDKVRIYEEDSFARELFPIVSEYDFYSNEERDAELACFRKMIKTHDGYYGYGVWKVVKHRNGKYYYLNFED